VKDHILDMFSRCHDGDPSPDLVIEQAGALVDFVNKNRDLLVPEVCRADKLVIEAIEGLSAAILESIETEARNHAEAERIWREEYQRQYLGGQVGPYGERWGKP